MALIVSTTIYGPVDKPVLPGARLKHPLDRFRCVSTGRQSRGSAGLMAVAINLGASRRIRVLDETAIVEIEGSFNGAGWNWTASPAISGTPEGRLHACFDKEASDPGTRKSRVTGSCTGKSGATDKFTSNLWECGQEGSNDRRNIMRQLASTRAKRDSNFQKAFEIEKKGSLSIVFGDREKSTKTRSKQNDMQPQGCEWRDEIEFAAGPLSDVVLHGAVFISGANFSRARWVVRQSARPARRRARRNSWRAREKSAAN